MKKVRFPWRPILNPDKDYWGKFKVSGGLLTPIYREKLSAYRRRRYNGLRHASLGNSRTMENRIVGNVLEKNVNFLSRHLILSPTVLEKLKENGVISESLKRQLAFKDTDEQIPFFVQSIRDCSLLTFKRFLAVLRETGHGWMVDVLLSTQALSYEELASNQPGRYPGLAQDPDPLGQGSRLHGMTPEHARMRLTSAGLRGRGGGVGGDGYGGAGLGSRGLDHTGIGAIGEETYSRTRFGDPGLRGRGLDDIGIGGGLGARGLNRTRFDGAGLENLNAFPPQGDVSLGNLLDGRIRQNPGGSARYRGQVAPGRFLGEPMRGQAGGILTDDVVAPGDVTGALISLHDHFRTQGDTNEQNLTILRREEMAIKELLEQNSREQTRVRRNQNALTDISRRLEEVNARANDVHDPTMHNHLSRYRLNQLNQIPWSNDR